MRRFLSLVGCLILWVSPLHAAQLRVENTSGLTASTLPPGSSAVTMRIVAVTESGDGLPGVGWVGVSGFDISYSVSGSATITGFTSTNVVIGDAFDDDISTGKDDTPRTVRDLIFILGIANDSPPGKTVGDRVTLATITFQVTGAQAGDTITVSAADSADPPEALATDAGLPVTVSSRTPHTITVQGGGNVAPTADTPSQVFVAVNEQVLLFLTGSDPDNQPNPLGFSVVSGTEPTLGSLGSLVFVSSTSRQVVYTAGSVVGNDSFQFRVSDGELSDVALVSITVTSEGQNTAPIAFAQNVFTAENQSKFITLNGFDADGNSLTFQITSVVTAGTLCCVPPTLLYTPPNGFNGMASFAFKANDGTVDSAPVTVTITVGSGEDDPVNQPPTAFGNTFNTGVNQAISFNLIGFDPEGGALTFTVVNQPTLGTLSPATGPNAGRTYFPGLNVSNVQDSFTFTVTDVGGLTSNLATVVINIGPDPSVNRPPTVIDINITTSINTPVPVVLSGSDPDGDPLTFQILFGGPARGFLTGVIPNGLIYNPQPGFIGLDTISYRATDDRNLSSNTGTIRITVKPEDNDPPTAQNQTVNTTSVDEVVIVLGASDPDGDALSFDITSGPFNGLLTGFAPNLRYRPNPGFVGTDSFNFVANDGTFNSNVATVTIVVAEFNNPPVANNQTVDVVEDTPKAITLTASDADGDSLTYAVLFAPQNGSLDGIPPNVTYTPDPGFNGSDFFTFRANDTKDDSNIAQVSITISPVNDPPTADPGANRSVECGTPVILDGSGSSDPESDALTYLWTGSFGTATGVQPVVELELGPHAITLVVNDGTSDSAPVPVVITIEDTIAPALSCPGLELVNRTEPTGTPASNPLIQTWLASAFATDSCDSDPQVFHDAPSFFPLGRTDVTFMAIDAAGNMSACTEPMVVLMTAEGDLDGDGDVDAADFMLASQDFTGPGVGTSKSLADLNGDGSVSLVDWLLLMSLFTGSK